MAAVLVSAKVSVFYSKFNKTFPKSSQRFYLAQTLIKHKKNWVACQLALSFNAPS